MKKQTNSFKVYDSLGYYVASFKSYQEALAYKMLVAQRPDWAIKERK